MLKRESVPEQTLLLFYVSVLITFTHIARR